MISIIAHLCNLMSGSITWVLPCCTSVTRVALKSQFKFFHGNFHTMAYKNQPTCPRVEHVSVIETLWMSHLRLSQSCRFLSVPSEHLPSSGHQRHSRSALLALFSGVARQVVQSLCMLQVSSALNTIAVSFLM